MKVDAVTHAYIDDHSGDEDDGEFGSDLLDSSGNSSGGKADGKKSNKPIMEKRRRARINNCLNDLKGILLEAMRKDPARHSKLEKADILELTVRHLQNIQRNQLAVAMATDPTVLQRFKNGFAECATEVSRYLGRLDGVENGMRSRVNNHLSSCVNGLQQVGPMAFGSPRYQPPVSNIPFQIIPSPVTPGNTVPVAMHPTTPQSGPIGILSPPATQPIHMTSGDLNNNSRFGPSATSPASATITSSTFHLHRNRINVNFASTPKRPPTPPPSPPPLSRRLTMEGLNEQPVSIVSSMQTRILVSNPLDFSVAKEGANFQKSRDPRIGKVEPIVKSGSGSGQKDMWRPW